MSDSRERRPLDWVAPGGRWPSGPFLAGTPRTVCYGAAFAANADAALARAGSGATIGRLLGTVAINEIMGDALAGERLPTLELVTAMEDALGCALWPTRDQVRDTDTSFSD